MQENTNKAIAINSIILYVRMGISIICGLLTTRFSLSALGIVDFGLFSVLGGLISFISIINTVMVSTSNRFIAVAIGKGNIEGINNQFNVNLSIHVFIAIFTILIAFPLGEWYIHYFVNYDGNIQNAIMVYTLTLVGSAFTIISVPFHGLLMARERFFVFSMVEVISHILKLFFTYLLVHHFEDYNKLYLYTLMTVLLTSYPPLVYAFYCHRAFPDITRIRIVKDKKMYKRVFSFSAWVAYGAVATVAKAQGAALIINAFFSTVMNAGLAIANGINQYIILFAENITKPMAPQITKSYSSGNTKRTEELLIMSTKYSFLMMLLISSPFFVNSEWIIYLWLGRVPEYSVLFLTLIIVDALVGSFNSGISNVIFASGKIKMYQIVINTLRLSAIFIAFIVLKYGAPFYALFYVYILITCLIVIANQVILHKTLGYDNTLLLKKAYIPSISVFLFFVPLLFIQLPIHPLLGIVISFIYLAIIVFFVGLNSMERNSIIKMVNKLKR